MDRVNQYLTIIKWNSWFFKGEGSLFQHLVEVAQNIVKNFRSINIWEDYILSGNY